MQEEQIGLWFVTGLFVACFFLSFLIAMGAERLKLINFAVWGTVISGIGLIAMFIVLGFFYSKH
jgi:hypothetical protein